MDSESWWVEQMLAVKAAWAADVERLEAERDRALRRTQAERTANEAIRVLEEERDGAIAGQVMLDDKLTLMEHRAIDAEARLAEVEAERDQKRDEAMRLYRRASDLIARLAEVEQALREAKEALDKTVPVLLTVKPNLDRPYPDALTLTPWTRWCEPLARRVDDARRSARAVLDKGEQPDG